MLTTLAVYAPHVREAGFVYEDGTDVDTQYRAWQGWATELHDAAVRPARAVARAVQRVVGFDPVAQHATSLALHLVCGLLVWAVASAWGSPWGATLAAGVFWLHPASVDAVAYASARPDVLMTLAVLLGLLAVQADRVGLAWLCAAVAVLCKESGVVAFGLLPLTAWVFGSRWSPRASMAWALSCAVPLVAAVLTLDARMDGLPALSRAWATLGWLLTRIVWPVGLTIDPAVTWAPALVLLALAALSVAIWAQGRSWLAFGWTWALVALAPRFVLPLHEGPHVAHLYLPMVGVSLAAGALVTQERMNPS